MSLCFLFNLAAFFLKIVDASVSGSRKTAISVATAGESEILGASQVSNILLRIPEDGKIKENMETRQKTARQPSMGLTKPDKMGAPRGPMKEIADLGEPFSSAKFFLLGVTLHPVCVTLPSSPMFPFFHS